MTDRESSFLAKAFNPVLQAGMALGAGMVFILVGKAIHGLGWLEVEADYPWMCVASFLLLFALFNSIFFLSAKNTLRYWGKSIYSFLGLAFVSGLMAWGFSQVPIEEAGSYRWIFIVVAIVYLVFLSIMNVMRRIVEFAQKEEWNHPRIRNQNRK